MPIDIQRPLKKLLPRLLEAQEKNLSEADTSLRIVRFFEEVLEYNLMTEITKEKQVKEKYVDIAIKIDGVFKFLVEVKAAGIKLRDRHIEQAKNYAAHDNIRWVLLTNGVVWNLYHLDFEKGIEDERVFTIDLSTDTLDNASKMLSLLHRQSIKKGEHERYWECRVALSPEKIRKALFSEDTLRLLRHQIKKLEGIRIDEEDLAKALHDMFSTETRERIGPVKIYWNKKPKTKQQAQPELLEEGLGPKESKPCDEKGMEGNQRIDEKKEEVIGGLFEK